VATKREGLQQDCLGGQNTIIDNYNALSNPRVSEESKNSARAQLEEMGGGSSIPEAAGSSDKDPGNVIRGLKASVAICRFHLC
jgi:hypothetical protein